ncbi:MAG: rhomboid family intramembrane serine protease [Puniceicoccales bacterium]|jgi:membrane associated rhomboid family serine protease|nr:rhomboid family intramembrane serine protease [Puniceicoccales bacterium]
MGLLDREYMRTAADALRGRRVWRWTVLRVLLATNLFVHLLHQFILPFFGDSAEMLLDEWFALSSSTFPTGKIWTVLTYSFLHANFWHLLGNIFLLWAAGRALERLRGERALLVSYAGGVLAGGVLWLVFATVFGSVPAYNIGASGGVFAVLTTLLLEWPEERLHFYVFFIPVSARKSVLLCILGGGTLAGMVLNEIPYLTDWWPVVWDGNTAHLCHFGGMLFALGAWGRARHKSRYPAFRFRRRRVRPLRQVIAFQTHQGRDAGASPGVAEFSQDAIPPPPPRDAAKVSSVVEAGPVSRSAPVPEGARASAPSPARVQGGQMGNTIPFGQPAASIRDGALRTPDRPAETPLMREVNRILDKINASGIGSLSDSERQTLDRASELLRR